MTSVVGSRGVNEFRFQSATDNLDRLSLRVGTPIEAQVRFRFGSRDSVGKFDFLPIFVEEEQLQIKNDFSYLFGAHDLKFGVDYSKDDLAQLFAGSRDGRYDFRSPEDFLNNEASNARIWFGDSTYPNYDETQAALAFYGQDSLKRDNLTLSYGLRYTSTDNPDGLDHMEPDGRQIPDTQNLAPRFGFALAQDEGRSVLRGGIGFFFGRTPTLLFANQVQANGVPPNYGRINVRPGQNGYVPLGSQINNEIRRRASFPRSPTWIPRLTMPRPCARAWAGNGNSAAAGAPESTSCTPRRPACSGTPTGTANSPVTTSTAVRCGTVASGGCRRDSRPAIPR